MMNQAGAAYREAKRVKAEAEEKKAVRDAARLKRLAESRDPRPTLHNSTPF